jgi:hypothetical protein
LAGHSCMLIAGRGNSPCKKMGFEIYLRKHFSQLTYLPDTSTHLPGNIPL